MITRLNYKIQKLYKQNSRRMDSRQMESTSKKNYARNLLNEQKQAYQGAKMFYYGVLPLSLIGLIMFSAFLYEESNSIIKDRFSQVTVWICLTTASYFIAVYFYIKCNKIESYPAESHTFSEQNSSSFELSIQQQIHSNVQHSNQDNSGLCSSFFNKPPRHFCNKCQRQSEYRTKHCRKCQTCIERFDHHCFWIGNCVGRHNHRQFYLFLIVQSFNNFAQMHSILKVKECAESLDFSLHWSIWLIIYGLLLTSFGFLCFTGYLAVYHTMLILMGLTTWQQMRKQRISYLKYLPRGYNPFSKGLINNIIKFFTQQTRASHKNCKLQEWEQFLPTYQEAKTINPGFNLIQNQYYSCC